MNLTKEDKKKLSRKNIYLILGLVGAVFLAISILTFKSHYKVRSQGVKTDGVISKIVNNGEDRDVYITFQTDAGRQVTFESSYSSSSMRTGDTLAVYYMKDNPQNAVVDTNGQTFLFVIFFLMGAGTFGAAVLVWRAQSRQIRFIQSPTAIVLDAVIADIKTSNLEVNKRKGMLILARTQDGIIYKSNSIFKPLNAKIDDAITVLVNPHNQKEYFVNYLPFI